MTICYFQLRNHVDLAIDEEGRDVGDAALIPGMALSEARAIISADALEGTIDLDQRIDVEDDQSTILHSLAFTDAVAILSP